MFGQIKTNFTALAIAFFVSACAVEERSTGNHVDVLIRGGMVYTGEESHAGELTDIGVAGEKIVFVGDAASANLTANRTIDATNFIVAPGFIDPHTHALSDLKSTERNQNINYLTQGVTTVLAGNDGEGPIEIASTLIALEENGIGTNAALFVGHNTLRQEVIGGAARAPSDAEIEKMRLLMRQAMKEGAIGFSSGLYYAPGIFAKTNELVELARVAAEYDAVYDSHIRDESSYSVGLMAAVMEALDIGKKSGAAVHIAHIKALGVDVWDMSEDVIRLIEEARESGQQVTADQYPWRASGTHVSNALIPSWAKAGTLEDMHARLRDDALQTRIRADIEENLRKRGGEEALLIVKGDDRFVGKTLGEIAQLLGLDVIDTAIEIVLGGDARVASFNMQESDIETFMKQPWVVSSSDGTEGHPRKYGSFPRKFRMYVKENKTLDIAQFIRQSSGLTAEIFGICNRGLISDGYFADIVIIDPENFAERADFAAPERLSTGVEHLLVNGVFVIENAEIKPVLAGAPINRENCTNKI